MPLLELTRKRKKPIVVEPLPIKKQSEDEFYEQAAEIDEMRRLYEKGLDFC